LATGSSKRTSNAIKQNPAAKAGPNTQIDHQAVVPLYCCKREGTIASGCISGKRCKMQGKTRQPQNSQDHQVASNETPAPSVRSNP
jgi:hypothetical protein